jgi:hypothetical protein
MKTFTGESITSVEQLENRRLFAADPLFTLTSKGTFIVEGTAASERFEISVPRKNVIRVLVTDTETSDAGLNTSHASEAKFSVAKRLRIDAGDGDDQIVTPGVFDRPHIRAATLLGGAGDDIIQFFSDMGAILADGGDGNDAVMCMPLRDIIVTHNRNRDVLNEHFATQNEPEPGSTLLGGAGNDEIWADTKDQVDGGAGNDTGTCVILNELTTPLTAQRKQELAHDYYGRIAVGIEVTHAD